MSKPEQYGVRRRSGGNQAGSNVGGNAGKNTDSTGRTRGSIHATGGSGSARGSGNSGGAGGFRLTRGSARPPGKPDVFQAVADPTRRGLLALLTDKDMAIAELVRHFPLSRTAINKHLQVLSEAGLVSSRRIGRETRYRLRPEPLVELKEWLAFFDRYWDEKLANLKRFVEADGGFAEGNAGVFAEGKPGGSAGGKDDRPEDADSARRIAEEGNTRRSEARADGNRSSATDHVDRLAVSGADVIRSSAEDDDDRLAVSGADVIRSSAKDDDHLAVTGADGTQCSLEGKAGGFTEMKSDSPEEAKDGSSGDSTGIRGAKKAPGSVKSIEDSGGRQRESPGGSRNDDWPVWMD